MSEPWAINAGKASTAIGTATIESDDNLLTITDHGLGDGDTVTVDTLTGGGSALTEDAVYFVRDVDGNDFALSLTLHGPQVEFATDGGADVYHFAPQYNAAQLRRLNAGLMFGGTSDAFGVRQGVRPGHVPLSVSGTTWTVEDLTGAVYPGLSSDDGGYPVAHQSESGSLDPADGANPRIDALDLQIQDDDTDASGFRRAHVVYVDGTPGADPDPPTVTTNALRLGTILVPAGGSPSPSIATLAQFTVASGGVLPVRDDTELPTAGLYDGMMAWKQDTHELVARRTDDDAWVPPVRGWQPIDSGSFTGSELVIDLTDGGRFPAGTFGRIRLTFAGSMDDASSDLLLRVNEDDTASLHQSAWTARRMSDGTIVDTFPTDDQTNWRIGQWHSGECTATVEILGTGASSGCEYLARTVRYSGVGGSHRDSFGSGRLTSNRLIDSVAVRVGAPALNFDALLWWAEGYRS